MSQDAARAALLRMNLCAVLIAPHCMSVAADLWQMARSDPKEAQAQFEQRKVELCEAYGFRGQTEQRKPFAFANGVAIIPVHGTLINRFSHSWGSVTGYNFLRAQAMAAGADPDVKLIVYDVNSFGGEAAGCFETARAMRAFHNGKPSMAAVDSNCYSAAYAVSTAADRIIVTPSGGAGSVGVVAMHIDISKALTDIGIVITFIHAGDHKVDGNPFEKLSAEVKADIQKGVNKSMDAFVGLTVEMRPNKLTEKGVRDMQARIYRAEEAQSLGLIDAVATPSEAVQAFLDESSGSESQQQAKANQESQMSSTPATPPAASSNAGTTTNEQAAAEARTAERARISGIQNCEEAKGRTALASHLALSTSMSVDEAKGILAASPKTTTTAAAPAVQPNPLEAAMAATGGGAGVGAEASAAAGAGGGVPDHIAQANEILTLQNQHTGTRLELVKSA